MSDAPSYSLPIPPGLIDLLARKVAALLAEQQPEEQPTTPWLDVREAADYLRVPLSTFRHQVSEGRWPVHRDGRRVYFHRQELDDSRRR